MSKLLTVAGAGLLILLSWLMAPVYQFYAHRNAVPLPPWGWETLSEAAPEQQLLLDAGYQAAGQRALLRMAGYRADNNLPGLSAAVAVGTKLVWAGAVGFSDLASAAAMTPQTLFRIGSTSKALTATALARLVERGDMGLDVPLSEYIADPPNPSWSAITARQLASHSAGIPHYGENADWAGLYRSTALNRHYADVRDSLAVFDSSQLLSEPGSAFHYSSLGTVLLGAAMSEAAGMSYRQLMREEVTEPGAMQSTFADGDDDPRRTQLATLYYTDGERFRPWRPVDISHRLPGGGFVSSPSDLARMGGLYFDAGYLSVETRTQFWTPQKLNNGLVNEQNYALGWRWREWQIDGLGTVRNANHGGVSRGSQCWLLVYPEHLLSMAFCSNVKTDAFATFGRFHEPLLRSFLES